jgi:carboxypeptidase family protein
MAFDLPSRPSHVLHTAIHPGAETDVDCRQRQDCLLPQSTFGSDEIGMQRQGYLSVAKPELYRRDGERFYLSEGHRRIVLVLFVVFTLSRGARSQVGSGTLRGQVTDPSGAVVAAGIVRVIAPARQMLTTKTNRGGAYELKGLAPGKYTVMISAKGFADYANQSVEVLAGQVQKLDIALAILVEQQNLIVNDTTGAVDVSSSGNASAVVMREKDLDALPDDPDELESDLRTMAGPAAGANEEQLYVDGFTAGHLPPKSTIREIRINQNPFSAEYDKMGYGRIEIFTKAGSDKLHGQFSVNGNSSAFNSRNPFLIQEPSYESTQFNGSVGGPINKSASFFFNMQRGNFNDEAVISAVVLDPSFNQVHLGSALPSPRTRTNISPRIDYQLGKNHSLTARYQFFEGAERNEGAGQLNLASQAYDATETEHTLQISDTALLSANTVNETRFQYIRDQNQQTAQTTQPTISVLGAFISGGNPLGNTIDTTHRYELQNSTSISRGKHLIKFGGRLRAYGDANDSTSGFNGAFTFPSLIAYQVTEQSLQQGLSPALIRTAGGGASQFSITTGYPKESVKLVDAAFYVQDEWRPRPNLVLSYGLRFESQSGIHDHADLAPRMGIAWGIGGKKNDAPKTVARAGFGVFYDRFTYDLVSQAERLNGTIQKQFIVNSPDFFPNLPPVDMLTGGKTFPTTYQIDPKLHAPYTIQTAISLERQISRNATLAISYLGSRGLHQLLSRNINAPLPGTYNSSDPKSGIRPLGNIGNIYQYKSEGVFKQNELVANVNLHAGPKLSLQGYYTLNYAKSDSAGPSSFPSNQYNIGADYGRAPYDIRHRLFISGTMALPHAFQLSPFFVANSGAPFDITVGQDLNGDSIFNDRPAFAIDKTRPAVVATRFGTFDKFPTPGEAIIPVNYGTGPGNFALNLRLGKTFGFGGRSERPGNLERTRGNHGGQKPRNALDRRYTLTMSVSARNILNHTNLGTRIGNLDSPLFGKSNGLAGSTYSSGGSNRRIDLQLLFAF